MTPIARRDVLIVLTAVNAACLPIYGVLYLFTLFLGENPADGAGARSALSGFALGSVVGPGVGWVVRRWFPRLAIATTALPLAPIALGVLFVFGIGIFGHTPMTGGS